MKLHKHNRETYANMVRLFKTEDRVAAVQPTGTGKSYLIMQLIEDNPDKKFCVCSPSTYIFEHMRRIADENGISIENVSFITYMKLMQTEPLEVFDHIVLDEFHRCGADEWGRGVQELLEINSGAKVFGTSATPIRYLDSGRNMADELFGGVYAVNMTLAEAIRKKILPLPVYVTSWYSFRGDIERLEMKAAESGDPRLKNVLIGKIRKAKSMIAELDVGIEKVFKKHIKNKSGKFIVFCPNVEKLETIKEECDPWFTEVNCEINKYIVHSQYAESDKQFDDFCSDKDEKALKLLFCIDMLNEGVHFDDVDGVIMLRATQSANVFYQQLGRALACSDSKKKPVIFDIVNNFETGDTAGQYASLMEISRESSGEYEDEIEFELYDYVRDIREILSELNDTFSNSWELNFELLKEYTVKYDGFPSQNTSYEGINLGKWCLYQRVLNNRGDLSGERKDKLNSIGFPWSLNEENWMSMYSELAGIVKKLGHFPKRAEVPNDSETMFTWLTTQRKKHHKGTLEPERAEMLESLGFDLKMIEKNRADWDVRFEQLKEFKEKHGRFPANSDAKKDELCRILCTWINSQRGRLLGNKMTPEHKEKLDSIEFPWSRQDALWNKNFELVCRYYAEHGTVPEVKTESEGMYIGKWFSQQIRHFTKGELSQERIERFNEKGIPLMSIREIHKMETWLKYYNAYVEYLEKYGEQPGAADKYNGLELRKWRSLQLKKLNEGKLTDEQAEMLERLWGD